MNEILESALAYASKGIAVLPVKVTNKAPYTKNGFKDATTDSGIIRKWFTHDYPNANVAIATDESMICIDVDRDDDTGEDGFQTLRNWEREHGELPQTWTDMTGRGGQHMFYRVPKGEVVSNEQGGQEVGIDIRGTDRGYVVVAPSIHANGNEYQWECGYAPDEIPIATIDDNVRQFIKFIHEASRKNEPQSKPFQVPEVIHSGERNGTLYKLACSLQAKGLSNSAITAAVEAENKNRCEVPLPDSEVIALVGSALNHDKGNFPKVEDVKAKLNLIPTKNGYVVEQSIENCVTAIENDEQLKGRILFNELSDVPCIIGCTPWKNDTLYRQWRNSDLSNLRLHLERTYGLTSSEKIETAVDIVCHRNIFNPIAALLEQLHSTWDGQCGHIESLFIEYLGVEDNTYNREVAKLVMLGAVKRALNKGCKFDSVAVLVGGQGARKSTFIQTLAMRDEWYLPNLSSFDSEKGYELIRGKWICEVAELSGMKRAKDVESIKAFITQRADTYRDKYTKYSVDHPRCCIFIGSTNDFSFLTDKTGNRRFLPVVCRLEHQTKSVFDAEQVKRDFPQAWGEAYQLYLENSDAELILPEDVARMASAQQEAFTADDWRVGMIEEYIKGHQSENICAKQLWDEALDMSNKEFKAKDASEINAIMRAMPDWKPVDTATGKARCGTYGVQKAYKYVPECPFD